MKQIILISTLILGLFACHPKANNSVEKVEDLQGTTWVLISPKNLKGSLKFSADNKQIVGDSGCNTYSAAIELQEKNIKVSPFMSTRMYCEKESPIEQEVMQKLEKATTYEVDDRNISFFAEDNTHLLTYVIQTK